MVKTSMFLTPYWREIARLDEKRIIYPSSPWFSGGFGAMQLIPGRQDRALPVGRPKGVHGRIPFDPFHLHGLQQCSRTRRAQKVFSMELIL